MIIAKHKMSSSNSGERLRQGLSQLQKVIDHTLGDDSFMRGYEDACEMLVGCYRTGGRLYIAGNGGSAADSQHLAAEFISRLERERGPLPAEALTTDSSILTAIANDYGFDEVFARQIKAKMQEGDVLLAISTSGQSENIEKAILACKESLGKSVLLTGKKRSRCSDCADISLHVQATRTATIQEVHIMLAHALCAEVEFGAFELDG